MALSRAEEMRATERRPCSQIWDCVAQVALRGTVSGFRVEMSYGDIHRVIRIFLQDGLDCLRILANERFQALHFGIERHARKITKTRLTLYPDSRILTLRRRSVSNQCTPFRYSLS